MIECTGYIAGDWMCYRCLQGTGIGAFVFVEDGDTADEQYLCETCADKVVGGDPLGRLRIRAVKENGGKAGE